MLLSAQGSHFFNFDTEIYAINERVRDANGYHLTQLFELSPMVDLVFVLVLVLRYNSAKSR